MADFKAALQGYTEYVYSNTKAPIQAINVLVGFWMFLAILYPVKLAVYILPDILLNAAHIVLLVYFIWTLMFFRKYAAGLIIIGIICLWLCYVLEEEGLALWPFAALVLVLLAIASYFLNRRKFIKPLWFADLKYLVLGPIWLVQYVYSLFDLSSPEA